jgi:hypothetical protein
MQNAVEDERDHGSLDVVEVFGRKAAESQGVANTFLIDTGEVRPCRRTMAVAGGESASKGLGTLDEGAGLALGV